MKTRAKNLYPLNPTSILGCTGGYSLTCIHNQCFEQVYESIILPLKNSLFLQLKKNSQYIAWAITIILQIKCLIIQIIKYALVNK